MHNNLCRLFIFILLITAIENRHVIAQEYQPDDKELARLLNEADGYYLYDQDYQSASVIYRKLLDYLPGNHNLSYKLGVCFLNITNKEDEALILLEFASENYVFDNEYYSQGKAAPFDVLYYLAFAYQINMRLEEAIDKYEEYSRQLRVKDASEIDYIKLQVRACRKALENIDLDYTLSKTLFAPYLGDFGNVLNPVISQNDSVFVFTSTEKEKGNRIFMSRKKEGEWDQPRDITSELGKHRDMYSNSITGDGRILVITRNDGIRGDIYLSECLGGSWSKINKLGKSINTRYWESHAAINADGSELFFASNREGGYGSLDLYSVSLDKDLNPGEVKNLGPSINTRLEENTPWFDSETSTLWFSSTGHSGYGGYDIYHSVFNKRWSKPVHAPYPVNTTADDLNYIQYRKDLCIISKAYDDTSANKSVFMASIELVPQDEEVILTGELKLDDGTDINTDQLKIEILDTASININNSVHSDTSGTLMTTIKPGNYELVYAHEGYRTDTLSISIPETRSSSKIDITHTLIPEEVANGDFLAIRTLLFDFNSYDLSREAMIELEKLIPVLLTHSDLRISIKGYTDSKGDKDYNLNLSRLRAEAVAAYLNNEGGIEPERLETAGMGSSEYLAQNINPDGTDNPSGRKYNRRVSISIKNNGYSMPVDSYLEIPGKIRKEYSCNYYVIIAESDSSMGQAYFSRFRRNEFAFLREIRSESSFLYALGGFRMRTDALAYLVSLREDGYDGAYLISEYELPDDLSSDSRKEFPYLYTIQIHALLNPPTNREFKGLNNVTVIKGLDGFYRYTVGEYKGYSKAREALKEIHSIGYTRAFIKEIVLLESQSLRHK